MYFIGISHIFTVRSLGMNRFVGEVLFLYSGVSFCRSNQLLSAASHPKPEVDTLFRKSERTTLSLSRNDLSPMTL